MDLERALEQFDRTEVNLGTLEGLWAAYHDADPGGVAFGFDTPEVDQVRRDWTSFVNALPRIDGFRPDPELYSMDALAHYRFDANEVGEPEAITSAEDAAIQPGRDLADYRHRLRSTRRGLVRVALDEAIRDIDAMLKATHATDSGLRFDDPLEIGWAYLNGRWDRIYKLMGSDRPKSGRWSDMSRHISFAEPNDLRDIVEWDWPSVRQSILDHAFEGEPLPVEVADLGELAGTAPSGPVSTALNWAVLDADSFERVVLEILRSSDGYENCERLMHVNATDKGRDLSAQRISIDSLSGTERVPVMIQCKHYQTGSVGLAECVQTVAQAKLWTDARFRVAVFATSGNFSQQAVEWLEARRESGEFPAVEAWGQSHLERLLASRPNIRSAFGL